MKRLFKLYRKLMLWSETRVVRCTMCPAYSDRQFLPGAERIARNHTHGTGHVVTVSRFDRPTTPGRIGVLPRRSAGARE
jgi:hypothetical protein